VRAFRAGDLDAVRRAERFERGHRTWAELRPAERREEIVVDSGLACGPNDPVLVQVTRHGPRTGVSDGGGAVERAGRPPGRRGLCERIEEELVRRIAEASLALYQDLLDLE